MELDYTYGKGKNQWNTDTEIYNTSLTIKWRPVEKTIYQSLSWTTEHSYTDTRDSTNGALRGLSSWIQWQFDRRWWLQTRLEAADPVKLEPFGANANIKRSFLIAFTPTEYSALRFQYDSINLKSLPKDEQRFMLQFSVSMGPHPAHAY